MSLLTDPLSIGTIQLRNRLYRAPVLEGAGSAPDPAKVYARHFVPNVKAGLGLVIQGNTIVTPEGRTSPGMSVIDDKPRMLALRPLTDAIHQAGGSIVIQLGHGGVFSVESWHTHYRPMRKQGPLAASKLRSWMRAFHPGGVHIMTTQEVEELVARFGVVAAWAREAGYDGVQLAGSNAKLLHQFMSPVHNRRRDRYGGSVEARMQLIIDIREAIAREAGSDYPVLLKYTAKELSPLTRGITLEDGLTYAKLAEQAGFAALTPVIADAVPNTAICRGDYPGVSFKQKGLRHKLLSATGSRLKFETLRLGAVIAAKRFPFKPAWNREIFRAVKQVTTLPIFAVGGILALLVRTELAFVGETIMGADQYNKVFTMHGLV
ncbi:MAG: hypothetical protein ACPG77_06860, partial [Nannocystaceae bacterium]